MKYRTRIYYTQEQKERMGDRWQAALLLQMKEEVREVCLEAGRLLVIPKDIWHTAKATGNARMLAVTAGQGTQHRPV